MRGLVDNDDLLRFLHAGAKLAAGTASGIEQDNDECHNYGQRYGLSIHVFWMCVKTHRVLLTVLAFYILILIVVPPPVAYTRLTAVATTANQRLITIRADLRRLDSVIVVIPFASTTRYQTTKQLVL